MKNENFKYNEKREKVSDVILAIIIITAITLCIIPYYNFFVEAHAYYEETQEETQSDDTIFIETSALEDVQ